MNPGEIQVLVEDTDGYEVLCGTLGELVLRVLDTLDMALFPRTPSVNEMNSLLTPVVHQLQTLKLWRYYEGLSGEQGYYRMAPAFADDCYRIEGSKLFGRQASKLWQTMRIQAEQWRKEKQMTGKQHTASQHKNQDWLGEPAGVKP